ncbi:hypothetical protein DC498_10490 [Terrimonas sp.]|uniref:class IIb bacteriocin, lactobin A/cerein 7B family n=1 Tax=Terrimonas sp. TaxID=1914338 RepID=UPI000D51E0F7|nr:class IIb bacteriocin, lactobin A/cerein 7B family [Terrimonas sp.]PVD52150.1 hypothetical protein DC498_10490 [Terrimonas sp.]
MKNIEMQCLVLTALTEDEMQEIDGGLLPLLIIGAAILLAGCSGQSSQSNGNSTQINVQCTNCSVTVKRDTVIVTPKY